MNKISQASPTPFKPHASRDRAFGRMPPPGNSTESNQQPLPSGHVLAGREPIGATAGRHVIFSAEDDLKTFGPVWNGIKTQRGKVLEYLQSNLWISREDAARDLGIPHLRARINELRAEGYDIVEGRILHPTMTRSNVVFSIRLKIPESYFDVFRINGFGIREVISFFLSLNCAGFISISPDDVDSVQLLSAALFLIEMQIGPRD